MEHYENEKEQLEKKVKALEAELKTVKEHKDILALAICNMQRQIEADKGE